MFCLVLANIYTSCARSERIISKNAGVPQKSNSGFQNNTTGN